MPENLRFWKPKVHTFVVHIYCMDSTWFRFGWRVNSQNTKWFIIYVFYDVDGDLRKFCLGGAMAILWALWYNKNYMSQRTPSLVIYLWNIYVSVVARCYLFLYRAEIWRFFRGKEISLLTSSLDRIVYFLRSGILKRGYESTPNIKSVEHCYWETMENSHFFGWLSPLDIRNSREIYQSTAHRSFIDI